jgi:hypothetical protein
MNEIAKLWLGAYDEALSGIADNNIVYDGEDYTVRLSTKNNKPYSHIKQYIASVKEQLDSMDPVAKISGIIDYEEFRDTAQGINAARVSWAKKKIKEMRTVYRKEIGTFKVDERRISNAVSYYKPYNVGATAAFEAIPDVIEKGIVAGRSYGDMVNGQKVDSITFAAPVEIKGQRGNMGVSLHIFPKSNLLEAYRIVLPDGREFTLEDKKETEQALLRVWPLKNKSGRNNRGTTSVSNDIFTQDEIVVKTRKSQA